MASLRLQRVRELLKREIGEAVRREFHVSEAGLITVNDVDVAGDLKSATVFISILGNPDQQKRGFQLLNEHRVRIQGFIGRAVVLKYTPKLKLPSMIPSYAATACSRSLRNWKKPCRRTQMKFNREKLSENH